MTQTKTNTEGFSFTYLTVIDLDVVLQPKAYLSLHCDDEELHREAQDVPRVKAVPNGQKEQR